MLDSRGKEIGHNFTERVTFVIVPGAKVVNTIGGIGAEANVQAALAAVQKLAAAK